MKKTLKTIAFPFVKLSDWILQFLMYVLYVAVRIMKSPLTKTPLDNLKHWNADTETAINQRSKDLTGLFALIIPSVVLYFFGWLWLILTLSLYVLIIAGVFLYALPKKDAGKRETNEK